MGEYKIYNAGSETAAPNLPARSYSILNTRLLPVAHAKAHNATSTGELLKTQNFSIPACPDQRQSPAHRGTMLVNDAQNPVTHYLPQISPSHLQPGRISQNGQSNRTEMVVAPMDAAWYGRSKGVWATNNDIKHEISSFDDPSRSGGPSPVNAPCDDVWKKVPNSSNMSVAATNAIHGAATENSNDTVNQRKRLSDAQRLLVAPLSNAKSDRYGLSAKNDTLMFSASSLHGPVAYAHSDVAAGRLRLGGSVSSAPGPALSHPPRSGSAPGFVKDDGSQVYINTYSNSSFPANWLGSVASGGNPPTSQTFPGMHSSLIDGNTAIGVPPPPAPDIENNMGSNSINSKDKRNGSRMDSRYKMNLCNFFFKDRCKNGGNCRFAHGMTELRGPLPKRNDSKRKKGLRKQSATRSQGNPANQDGGGAAGCSEVSLSDPYTGVTSIESEISDDERSAYEDTGIWNCGIQGIEDDRRPVDAASITIAPTGRLQWDAQVSPPTVSEDASAAVSTTEMLAQVIAFLENSKATISADTTPKAVNRTQLMELPTGNDSTGFTYAGQKIQLPNAKNYVYEQECHRSAVTRSLEGILSYLEKSDIHSADGFLEGVACSVPRLHDVGCSEVEAITEKSSSRILLDQPVHGLPVEDAGYIFDMISPQNFPHVALGYNADLNSGSSSTALVQSMMHCVGSPVITDTISTNCSSQGDLASLDQARDAKYLDDLLSVGSHFSSTNDTNSVDDDLRNTSRFSEMVARLGDTAGGMHDYEGSSESFMGVVDRLANVGTRSDYEVPHSMAANKSQLEPSPVVASFMANTTSTKSDNFPRFSPVAGAFQELTKGGLGSNVAAGVAAYRTRGGAVQTECLNPSTVMESGGRIGNSAVDGKRTFSSGDNAFSEELPNLLALMRSFPEIFANSSGQFEERDATRQGSEIKNCDTNCYAPPGYRFPDCTDGWSSLMSTSLRSYDNKQCGSGCDKYSDNRANMESLCMKALNSCRGIPGSSISFHSLLRDEFSELENLPALPSSHTGLSPALLVNDDRNIAESRSTINFDGVQDILKGPRGVESSTMSSGSGLTEMNMHALERAYPVGSRLRMSSKGVSATNTAEETFDWLSHSLRRRLLMASSDQSLLNPAESLDILGGITSASKLEAGTANTASDSLRVSSSVLQPSSLHLRHPAAGLARSSGLQQLHGYNQAGSHCTKRDEDREDYHKITANNTVVSTNGDSAANLRDTQYVLNPATYAESRGDNFSRSHINMNVPLGTMKPVDPRFNAISDMENQALSDTAFIGNRGLDDMDACTFGRFGTGYVNAEPEDTLCNNLRMKDPIFNRESTDRSPVMDGNCVVNLDNLQRGNAMVNLPHEKAIARTSENMQCFAKGPVHDVAQYSRGLSKELGEPLLTACDVGHGVDHYELLRNNFPGHFLGETSKQQLASILRVALGNSPTYPCLVEHAEQ